MQHFVYLAAMLTALGGFVWLDWRLKLALFWNVRKTLIVLGTMQIVFVLWDIVNLRFGTFFTSQAWVTGAHVVTSNMPIEELVFFVFLDYQILLLWRWQCTRISS